MGGRLVLSSSFHSVPLILRNTNRYRRDARQLEEEEEIWFNEDDDFVETPPVKTPEIENTGEGNLIVFVKELSLRVFELNFLGFELSFIRFTFFLIVVGLNLPRFELRLTDFKLSLAEMGRN